MALHYNGLNFVYVNTAGHVMGNVRDPSGSDQMLTSISLDCRAILNVAFVPGIAADPTPGATVARIRHLLTQPRRPMYYDINSPPAQGAAYPAISASAIINLPDGRDDYGGPWPDEPSCQVIWTSPKTLEVAWKCTVKLRDCGASLADENSPLSCRWEDSLTWGEDGRASFTRNGTLIISTRSVRTIDWFRRNRLWMSVPSGFKRKKAYYLASRDGLRCDFTFQDDQHRGAPPYPAHDMKIIQSESAPFYGGMKKGQVAVRLEGMQNANVIDLARWALVILKARVWAANPITTQGKVLGQCVVETTEGTENVSVQASASYKIQPDKKREVETNGGAGQPQTIDLTGDSGSGPDKRIPAPNKPPVVFGIPIGSAVPSGGTQPTPPAQSPPSPPVPPPQATSPAPGPELGGRGWVGWDATLRWLGGNRIATAVTQQGRAPFAMSSFPWIGRGTSPASPSNPQGFAEWFNPTASIGPPAEGFGTARAMSFFAALLRDPCGNELAVNPYTLVEQELLLGQRPDATPPTSNQRTRSGQPVASTAASVGSSTIAGAWTATYFGNSGSPVTGGASFSSEPLVTTGNSSLTGGRSGAFPTWGGGSYPNVGSAFGPR